MLSVTEVAELLRIHRATVYDLLATGELRSTTLGRRRLIPRAALEEFVASMDRRAEREAAECRAMARRSGDLDGSARDM
jgi:excisionase family DNA binding protein